MNIPKYQCHKTVHAFEIGKIEGNVIYPSKSGIGALAVDPEFISKHPLNEPGYIVIYEDGYKSYSPKAIFEAGYTITKNDINKSGKSAFLQGKSREDNPFNRRTNANAKTRWDNEWLLASQIPCKGIELIKGVYSGCNASFGDCP